jgi:GNAT superfamily N-acetyltransferase
VTPVTDSLGLVSQIRPLAPADHDAWLPLWHGYIEFYESEVSDEQTQLTWDRLLDPRFPIHGALALDDAGRAIGFVHWLTHAATWSAVPYVYLEDLFVASDTRGAGAGRALIAHVTEWARERGAAKVYWLTQETNATARALYDRVATHTGFVHYEIGLDR